MTASHTVLPDQPAPLDFAADAAFDAFALSPPWAADDLAQAMPAPLHRFDFAPSANDAAMHRPRRGGSFLRATPLPPRFRIG